jgi:type II secretory ATPase GspE/PulE/Tfp pilus assembly ATPase PilB-like protein
MPQPEALDPSDRLASLDVSSGDAAIDDRLNVPQMLTLIDSVLPFEACLYYQVIPLSIDASLLNLGMVNPEDTTATDYVRRQVSYINCSVVSWPITSDWHRQMLSRYLSYAAKLKQQSAQGTTSVKPPTELPAIDQATFIVDSPEDIFAGVAAATAPESLSSVSPPDSSDLTPEAQNDDRTNDDGAIAPQQPSPLEISPQETATVADLAQSQALPPKQLTVLLLQQVLAEGIGRLYFERQPNHGRILWSKDGVVQSALETLSLEVFQSVINEFKRLAHLPMVAPPQTQQVDIERLFQGERVLLRFRLIAGQHGEEATLQVLRGAALRFYQQQQINHLGRDALSIAQDLQKRIIEIRDRSRQALASDPVSTANRVTLDDLLTLLRTIEAQIEQITQNPKQP